MPQSKIVAHYVDGRILKGTTVNFNPSRPDFLLSVADAGLDKPVTVRLADLKALFFVRNFLGDAAHNEAQTFAPGAIGRKFAVTFTDGERLLGTSLTYTASREGFFLFPADPQSNNERAYVVMRAVSRVETV
jgi:hypothetical protein